MSILNKAPRPDDRPEHERVQVAKGVIELLVQRNLIPLYSHFRVDELFKELDGEEKSQAYPVADLVEKILSGHGLIKTNQHLNLRKDLTEKGRDMMNFGSFFLWEENNRKITEPSFNYSQTFNAAGNIVGSGNVQSDLRDSLSESPITHNVTTTPKIKAKATSWYTSPLFIYFIWPR